MGTILPGGSRGEPPKPKCRNEPRKPTSALTFSPSAVFTRGGGGGARKDQQQLSGSVHLLRSGYLFPPVMVPAFRESPEEKSRNSPESITLARGGLGT